MGYFDTLYVLFFNHKQHGWVQKAKRTQSCEDIFNPSKNLSSTELNISLKNPAIRLTNLLLAIKTKAVPKAGREINLSTK